MQINFKKEENMTRIKVSKAVYEKTRYSLVAYCELKNLSYTSLKKGFLSEKTKEVLKADGIDVDSLNYRNKAEDEDHVA